MTLWGWGGKRPQNTLRSLCKCVILLLYPTSAAEWCCSSALQMTPPHRWRTWPLQTEATYRSTYWATHRWDPAPLRSMEPSARAPSHSRMWGGAGSALLHRFAWLTQVWAPISTGARGTRGSASEGPTLQTEHARSLYSLWRFCYCCTVLLVKKNTMGSSHCGTRSSPPSPNAKYKST